MSKSKKIVRVRFNKPIPDPTGKRRMDAMELLESDLQDVSFSAQGIVFKTKTGRRTVPWSNVAVFDDEDANTPGE